MSKIFSFVFRVFIYVVYIVYFFFRWLGYRFTGHLFDVQILGCPTRTIPSYSPVDRLLQQNTTYQRWTLPIYICTLSMYIQYQLLSDLQAHSFPHWNLIQHEIIKQPHYYAVKLCFSICPYHVNWNIGNFRFGIFLNILYFGIWLHNSCRRKICKRVKMMSYYVLPPVLHLKITPSKLYCLCYSFEMICGQLKIEFPCWTW